MSAVATTEAVQTTDASIHLVESHGSTQEMHDTEQKRWMLWFGLPALIGCFFLGVTFATDSIWWLAAVLTALLVDIFMLVWLAMTSDTNGLIHDGTAPASAH